MTLFYAFLSINAFAVSVFMAHFVTKGSRDPRNRLFGALCLGVAVMAFAEFQLRTVESETSAGFWLRFAALYPVMATLLLRFSIEFSERHDLLRTRWSALMLWGPAVAFGLIELFTGALTGGPVEASWGWTYERGGSPHLGRILAIWLVATALFAILLCYQHYRRSTGQKRSQAKFVLVGLSIPVALGVLFEGIWPLAFGRIPELTITSFTFSSFFIAYGTSRYELFKISPTTAAENITEDMSDLLFLVDTDGSIVKSNRAARDLLGVRESALRGRSIASLFASVEGESPGSDWHRALVRGKGPGAFEAALMDAKERSVAMWFTASQVRDEMGEVRGVVLLGRDVSERMRALERERRYFHDLALLSQMAMEYVDLPPEVDIYEFLAEKVGVHVEKGYTFVLSYDASTDEAQVRAAFGVDGRLKRCLGMLGVELVGLRFPIRENLRPSTSRPHIRRLEGSLHDLLSGRFPKAAIGPVEGLLRIGGIFEAPLVNRGELLGSVVIVARVRELGNSDLIEALVNQASVAIGRKLALDALLESEKKYSTVVEQGNDGIIIIKEGIVRFMNARAKAMTGAKGAEPYDTLFLEFVVPEQRGMLVDRYERRLRGEQVPDRYEIEILSREGGRIPVEVNASVIEYAGGTAVLAI
ncbi:MAG: PAS domain S-box protein, partial [Thermoplasmata archaeon]|nr:PAS domain S-box protein [Thermoplasmata archaeon]